MISRWQRPLVAGLGACKEDPCFPWEIRWAVPSECRQHFQVHRGCKESGTTERLTSSASKDRIGVRGSSTSMWKAAAPQSSSLGGREAQGAGRDMDLIPRATAALFLGDFLKV